MQETNKPASKLKVALTWLFLIGNLVFWVYFWFWRGRDTEPEQAVLDFATSIFYIVIGIFFLIAGVASYLIVVFSDCLTFNFNRPIWRGIKVKLYLANVIVPLLGMLGVGFALTAFLGPVLARTGVSPGLAYMLPVIGVLIVAQIALYWVLIWVPLERRIITKRLLAQGITTAQLREAVLIGISNPARSSFKKFGLIEDDVGALWVAPEQIVFWGDGERFAIQRENLAHLERTADSGSMTMLSGMTHAILHVKLPEGSVRQIRLHPEGVWTMGRKRKVMDDLSSLIAAWHSTPSPAAVG
jgi:hypothetical protein